MWSVTWPPRLPSDIYMHLLEREQEGEREGGEEGKEAEENEYCW